MHVRLRKKTKGGVIYWPEAIKYLLLMYEMSGSIREDIMELRETARNGGEN